jgi:murein DD-endopeptidase MepM/ murein hydrolase activator NlpD
MTTRVLSAIAIAITGTILLCSGLATTLMFGGGGAAANCSTTAAGASTASPGISTGAHSPASGGIGPIGKWNAEQVGNAATIISVGLRLQIPPRGWVIAVATAMQESSLINTPGGDQDSIGLFQQRPSQDWGTPAQLQDPQYAATKFYQKLQTIDGWQAMPLIEAAQNVQVSAYPDAYAKWEPDATQIVGALTGVSAGLAACAATVSAQGWTQPVHGKVGSGFRTPDRPTHDGVDLIVPKGTPIHAASVGTVSRVRCNAIDVRTGGDWGCDRDGDPNLTAGCGWYVDIDHADGIVTRYCHQLVQPYVHEGQHVNAGDVIGISGSSGHSSGPHVHYEVHLGDHTSATAVDPVPFMASVGAPLDR